MKNVPSLAAITLSMFCLWMTGCASSQLNFSPYYKAITPLTKAPIPLPAQGVTGVNKLAALLSNGTPDPKNWIAMRNLQTQSHYTTIGVYVFTLGRLPTNQELAEMTAKMGGDYYYHVYWRAGTGTGTRMVMTGMTVPGSSFTTVQGSSYGNYNGNYQNSYGGWGTLNGNANAYGYANSQTYSTPTTSYQAVPFQYPVMGNFVTVLASPERQQQLIQQSDVTQATLDRFSLAERIKRGETPAVLK
jgi:hypothetical protein